jgi:2-polyprenyl-3-methyl-5-hydroxy-6-metoxy-1,4-benzoquinol methylase
MKSCIACGHDQFKDVFDVKDHSISQEVFELTECRHCGLRMTSSAPSESEIGLYYKSENYISHSDNKSGIINGLYHSVRNWMLGYKYRMCKAISNHKTLLDVGSGTGYFPHYMKNKGFEVMGVEVDESARKFSLERFGLDIKTPEDLLNGRIEQKFGFITLWHVLEHLYHPAKYLEAMIGRLEDDGIILVAVPNYPSFDARFYKDYWAAYDVPRHLWHFTPFSMKNLLSRHGLEIIDLKHMPFDPFYNALLSSGYRKDRFPLISGFFVGLASFVTGLFNVRKASSVIYVLKRMSVA